MFQGLHSAPIFRHALEYCKVSTVCHSSDIRVHIIMSALYSVQQHATNIVINLIV